MLVAMLGVALLSIFAVIEKSAVMFVSAGAVGVTLYLFRRARQRDRVVAIIAAGIGGSIGTEIVRTLYHFASVDEPGAESSGFFMSALLVGLVNAAVIIVVLFGTEAWLRFIARKP